MAKRSKKSFRSEQTSHHISAEEASQTIRRATDRLQRDETNLPVVKVVGMSGAGKSTLVRRLRAMGYNARTVSQEHSAIPDLWQQFGQPLVLLYLTLSLETQRERRADVGWTPEYFEIEEARLASAKIHADVRIDTSELTPDEVEAVALAFLRQANVRHTDYSLQPRPSTGSASSRAGAPTDTDSQT